jgi:hypothetical protein
LPPGKSWIWTSSPGHGVVTGMDDDTTDLIARLCTRVGMIMEDASVIALTISGSEPGDLPLAIDELEGAARQIKALVAAARALLD